METFGWASATIAGLTCITWIASHVLDQIPVICHKAAKAIRSIRALRNEIRSEAREREGTTPNER
ncbi:hypothetical protein [Streptomyces violaceusniger]|uniref:hypothetical protein n=1 Tax=Streptomyces violaceusniger TaxID=68280 RepID=UPI00123785A3|nr:hypothetical protein [Streptomyces violaceusniger]